MLVWGLLFPDYLYKYVRIAESFIRGSIYWVENIKKPAKWRVSCYFNSKKIISVPVEGLRMLEFWKHL